MLLAWLTVPTYHKVNELESRVSALKTELSVAQAEIRDLQDQLNKLVWISQDIDRRLIERGQ